MGNYKRPNKKQADIDAAIVSGARSYDIADEFKKAMNEAASMSNTAVIRNQEDAREDAVWLSENMLTFSDFCSSADHMNFPPLSERQRRVAEYMFGNDPKRIFDNNRNTAVLVWGKGGGKDTISALMKLYVVYILLNIKNPQRYLGLPDNVSIDLLNVAACVTRDTLVKVSGGWKPVADIVNGDMIATWDGLHQPVSKLFKFEKKPVFSVMLKNGMRVRCTDNHRFKVLSGGGWAEIELKDLSVGNVLWYGQGLSFGGSGYTSKIPYEKRTSARPIFGPEMVVTNDIAYMLGLAVSDGYMAKMRVDGGRYVGWVVPEHQPEIAAEVERIGRESFCGRLTKLVQRAGRKSSFKSTKDLYNYKLCSRDFYDHAIGMGMRSGGKKGHKGFPWKLLTGSRDQVRHLLAGMFDGDGSFSREIKYYSVSEEIIGWAAMALNGLGISTDVWFGNGIFNLTIPNSEVDKFLAEVPIRRNVGGRGMDRRTGPSKARKFHFVMDMVKADCGITGRYNKDGQTSCLVDTLPAPQTGTMTDLLLRSRVYSSPIFSIHADGVEDVFDYEALPDKEMVANGIMSIDSKEQAQTVYFQILKTMVMNWSWLRNQYDIAINGRFFSSGQSDEIDLTRKVTVTNDAIIFPKNIRAFSGSCEAETLEGKNLLMFVLDEADAFKSGSQIRSASKIYRTVRTSAVSRFGRKYKGFIISYPRSSTGFIMTMYKQSRKFLNMYGDIAKTWEVKPRELFSEETFSFEGYDIPMEFYEDFRLDPNGSKSAYICDPPRVESLFLDDPEKVELATAGFVRPLFDFKDSIVGEYVRKSVLRSPFMYDKSISHVMLLDLSLKNDSTALTLMHRNEDKIIVDFSTVWVPDPRQKLVVDLQNVEEVIDAIRKEVTISGLYCDRWQSAMLVQKLRGRGVKADTVKLEYDDFELFKRLLYAGNIQLPKNDRLLNELKSLQQVTSQRVDHGEGGHNDMAVTIVMGVKMLAKTTTSDGGLGLIAEGEFVGDNLSGTTDEFAEYIPDKPIGLQIDGFPIQ